MKIINLDMRPTPEKTKCWGNVLKHAPDAELAYLESLHPERKADYMQKLVDAVCAEYLRTTRRRLDKHGGRK